MTRLADPARLPAQANLVQYVGAGVLFTLGLSFLERRRESVPADFYPQRGHEGVVNTVLVGLRGLVGQLYREDNAHKVRRGQAGRVKQGLAGGGLTYGYAAIAGKSGERVVLEAEAQVIPRIFQE